MRKHLTLLASVMWALFCCAPGVRAQTVSVLNEYKVQPEVWHLARPEQPGVDGYGDLSLSLPLMKVPGRGIDFDIALGYRSSILYMQAAGWIGTGWSFDPGSISREIEGATLGATVCGVDNFDGASCSPQRSPDVFYITIPGKGSVAATMSNISGYETYESTLPIYMEGDIVPDEQKPWKITYTMSTTPPTIGSCSQCTPGVQTTTAGGFTPKNDIISITVTTEDGTRYVFAQPTLGYHDLTTSGGASFRQIYVSTWRLVAILGLDWSGSNPEAPADSDPGAWVRFKYSPIQTATSSQDGPIDKVSQARYLSAIVTPTHEADFTLGYQDDSTVPDYVQSAGLLQRLTSVKLYSKLSGSKVLIRKVVLGQVQYGLGPKKEASGGRLRLDSLTFYGLGGDSISAPRIQPGYHFQYFDPQVGADVDPEIRCMDDFGFYSLTNLRSQTSCGSSTPDVTGGSAWSLTRIDYPSGGYATFSYATDSIGVASVPYVLDDAGGTITNASYAINSATKRRQGGARLTSVTRSDGLTAPAETRYSYGTGHVTGVPPGSWTHSSAGPSTRLYTPSNRGKVAVVYEWIKETKPDNSTITTYYTTPAGPGFSSFIKTITTVEVRTVYSFHSPDPYCNPNGAGSLDCQDISIIQGNQHWTWAHPYKIEYRDASGRKVKDVVREVHLVPTSGASPIASGWDAQPSLAYVPIEMGDYRVNKETATEYAPSDSATAVTSIVSYNYDSLTGLVRETLEQGQYFSRWTTIQFLHEINTTTGTNDLNMLSQVIRKDVARNDGNEMRTYYSSEVTTWRQPPGFSYWAPWRELSWSASSPSSTQPPFTEWTTTTVPSGWVEDRVYESYDAHGHVIQQKDARGVITKFYYGENNNPYFQTLGLKSAYLTGVRLLAGTTDNNTKDLKVALRYDLNWGTVTQVLDPDSTHYRYGYDGFGRLLLASDDNFTVVKRYSYTFPSATNGILNTPGVVRTDSYLNSTAKTTRREYYDGLARLVQTHVENDTSDIVSAITYDAEGRTWKAWKPYTLNADTSATAKGYDLNFSTNAAAYYDGNPGPPANGRPYAETLYLPDGLDRPYRSIPEGSSGHKEYDYGIDVIYGRNYTYTRTIDEAGKVSRQYVDAPGRTVMVRQATVVSPNTSTTTLQSITSSVTRPSSMTYPYVSNTETNTFIVDAGQEAITWTATFSTNCGTSSLGRLSIYNADNVAVANVSASSSTTQTGTFTGVVGETYRMEAYASATQNDPAGCTFTTSGDAKYTQTTYTDTQWADTQFAPDVAERLTQVTAPEGQQITYTYNMLGQLTGKVNPDAGSVQYKYDRGGNRRFSQDAKQAAAGKVLFTTYDFANRPLTAGEGAATFSTLDPNASYSFESTTSNWISANQYDRIPDAGTFPWSLFGTQINGSTMLNLKGRLAATAYKSGGVWQLTLYNYNTLGQVANKYVYTQQTGGGSVNTSVNTTFTYTYDLQGNVTNRQSTVGGNTFFLFYDYDAAGRLSKVYTSLSATRPTAPDVTYTYNPTGTTASVQYQGNVSLPYTYTIRDWMASMGNTASTAYPFSAAYTYYPNGNVGYAEFYNGGPSSSNKRYRFYHSYDGLNRLTAADFSYYTTSWQNPTWFDLSGMTYSLNGNLLTLNRNRLNGFPLDRLTYHYQTGKNRLDYVDEASSFSETWDAKDSAPGAFTYDPNGNLVTAPAPYSITSTTYDERNLPTSITRSGTTTSYRYSADGQRYWKQSGSTSAGTFYVQDGSITAGVFTDTGVLSYWNIIAGGRVIGRYESGVKKYYYADALGSIRAVVDAGGTVVEARNYDAWGYELAGKSYLSGTAAKEKFTGKERDAETGLDYFGARYYMPAYGRWASVDPMMDLYSGVSPYVYVLNNPATLTDPDGRCVAGLPCPWLGESGAGIRCRLLGGSH